LAFFNFIITLKVNETEDLIGLFLASIGFALEEKCFLSLEKKSCLFK